MSGMDNSPNENVTDTTQTRKPMAFCQNCGKPLEQDTLRRVGTAVFCEPCLAARISGTQDPNQPPFATPAGGAWTIPPVPPMAPSEPNPGLAALLGLIPGVGAMYNEQYGKGLIHLGIFAVLVIFAHMADIFGIFIVGWEFYMAIEAHHTAKARRDGMPLPDPFGFNSLADRMGFGKAGPNVAEAARDAMNTATAGFASATAAGNRGPAAAWGARAEAYPRPAAYDNSAWQQPPAQPFTAPGTDASYGPVHDPASPYPGSPYPAGAYPAGQYPAGPYAGDPAYGAPVPAPGVPQSRFPAGAVWLIGLGIVFLLSTTGIFRGIRGDALVGSALMGGGVWLFLRRMTEAGGSLASDGSPAYQMRLLLAIRAGVWLAAIGLLITLNALHVVYWSHSWPWLIIVAGLMALLQRSIANAAAAAYIATPPYNPAAAAPAAPASSDTHLNGGR